MNKEIEKIYNKRKELHEQLLQLDIELDDILKNNSGYVGISDWMQDGLKYGYFEYIRKMPNTCRPIWEVLDAKDDN